MKNSKTNKYANIAGFLMLCQSTQDDLLSYFEKTFNNMFGKNNVKKTDSYLYAKGTLPVMLVAHLDTVHRQLPKNIWTTLDEKIIKSSEGIGGDDRCGVYIISYVLNNIKNNKYPSVLFTTDEEIGCVGAIVAAKELENEIGKINFMVEVDRRGKKDSVFYGTENKEFEEYINGFGFEKATGSCSDISKLSPKWGMASVNLSSGYYREHTSDEYVNLEEMVDTAKKVLKIVISSKTTKFFKYKKDKKDNVTNLNSTSKDHSNCRVTTLPSNINSMDDLGYWNSLYGCDNINDPFFSN